MVRPQQPQLCPWEGQDTQWFHNPGASCLCQQTHFSLISSTGYNTSLPGALLGAEAVGREMDEVLLPV